MPHAGPMALLDEVVRFAGETIVCRTRACAERALGEKPDAAVPAWVAIEYAAQAVAAYAGMEARARGEPVRVGFLLGTRGLDLRRGELAAAEPIEVIARRAWWGGVMGVFECAVNSLADGSVVVEGNLNVYLPKNVETVYYGD